MAIVQTVNNSFGYKISICQFCKNKECDKSNVSRCAVLGEIPDAIASAYILKCHAFLVDYKLYAQYEPFLPSDFDINEVTEIEDDIIP